MDVTLRRIAPWSCLATAGIAFFLLSDGSAPGSGGPRSGSEALLSAPARQARVEAWAAHLAGIEVGRTRSPETAVVRLYRGDGDIDPEARATFERIAASEDEAHPLAARLEQLAFKAAYHFTNAAIIVVSAWRANAGRHGTAEALDFRLRGVAARTLAAYLRTLPRAGVGVYTNRRTQFVHLDVRDTSFHWLDASPPGAKWHEAQIGDRTCVKRDASWTPEMDLP